MTCPKVLDVTIDSSWHLILAAGFLRGWQWGVDLVYTYGPLGYFGVSHPNYVKSLFYPAVATSLATGLIFAWAFVRRGARLPGAAARTVYFATLALVVPVLSPVGDAVALLAIVCVTDSAIEWGAVAASPRIVLAVAGVASFLAALSLVKFTYLILSVVCVTAVVAASASRRSWRTALAAGSVYPAAVVVAWLASGQRLGNLPAYLRRSWNLADAYNAAMSLPAGGIALALAAAAGIAVVVVVMLDVGQSPRDPWRWARAAPLLAALALAWMASFGRYDAVHAGIFSCVAAVGPFLVAPPQPSPARFRSVPLASRVAVSLALVGAFVVARPMGVSPDRFVTAWWDRLATNVRTLVEPWQARRDLDLLLEDEAKAKALPRIREAVGDGTVDMFPPEQGLVFLNGLTYAPRPMPQGFLAITPSLLEANRRYYEDPERAPDYVLFGVMPIDSRFPTMEDSQALLTLLRGYDPVLAEGGLVLMGRRGDGPRAAGNRHPVAERTVTLGQWTEVPDDGSGLVLATIVVRRSLAGRLRSAIYPCAPVYLEVATADGAKASRRLIPEISGEPFLVSPLMRNQGDWLTLFGGGVPPRVKALRVVTGDGPAACFDRDVRVSFLDARGLRDRGE